MTYRVGGEYAGDRHVGRDRRWKAQFGRTDGHLGVGLWVLSTFALSRVERAPAVFPPLEDGYGRFAAGYVFQWT